jgi:flagellin
MALYIQSNISALQTENTLASTTSALQTSMQRLSTGYRINSAADDAAGLGIHMSLNAQVQSLSQCSNNANDGVSLVQTADGASGQLGDIMTTMRQLATQSANGTLSASDRTNIGAEFGQLQSEMTRIVKSASFNGQNLLTSTANVKIQVGTGTTAAVDQIAVGLSGLSVGGAVLKCLSAGKNGLNVSAVGVGTAASALKAISSLSAAIGTLGHARALFGASINRLNYASSQITTRQTNLTAADSRIMDVDVASETSNLSRLQVLQQAGTAMLSQANQSPQAALNLLH